MLHNLTHRIQLVANIIFNAIDAFFKGNDILSVAHSNGKGNVPLPFSHASNVVEWELNQHFSDIILKDVRFLLKPFLPSFIFHYLDTFFNEVFLYIYLDEIAFDEILIDQPISSDRFTLAPGFKCIYYQDHTRGNYQGSAFRTLFSVWKALIRKSWIIRAVNLKKLIAKTVIAPSILSDRQVNNNQHQIRGPDNSKLNPTFVYYIRI